MAGAIRNMMVRGGADFSKLDKALGKTSKNARNMQTSFGRATKGMQQSVTKLNGVLHMALAVAGVASFAALSKQAISTASDLEEVQNVVDTAFGKMSESAERFAQKAKLFNLSELQAKNSSSIYMAMAKSMGLAEEQASKMSIATAALSGDMSSFFNVSQDVSSTALKSIFTGETEPLKRFGVVMTENSLKAYALEKGISKSYKSMTDAEKVTLRYAFVMEKLNYVQGDAEKTADSWANKTRRLGERLKSILAIFGSGLINVLSGPLDVLDRLLDRLEYAAKLFKAITVKLYGDSGGSSGSAAIAAATGEAAGAAEDLEANITAAGEAAKKAVLPMDQLNKLGSADSGNSGDTAGLFADLSDAGSYYDDRLAADDIVDDGIAQEIEAKAQKIVDAINRIREKIANLKKNAFAKIGVDIETATAMDVINELLQFASDKVEELLGLFGINIDFGDMSFEGIKKKLRDLVEFVKEHKNQILAVIAGLLAWIAAFKIIDGIDKLGRAITLLGGSRKILSSLFNGLKKSIATVDIPIRKMTATIWGLRKPMSNLATDIDGLGGSMLALPCTQLSTNVSGMSKPFITLSTSVAKVAVPIAAIAAVVAIVIAALWQLYHTNDEVRQNLDMAWNGIKGLWEDVCTLFNTLWETVLQPVFAALGDTVGSLWNDVILPLVANLASKLPDLVKIIKVIVQTIIDIVNTVGPSIGKILTGVVEFIQGIVTIIGGIFSGDWSKVWEGFKTAAKGAVDFVVGIFEGLINLVKSGLDLINPFSWGAKIADAVGSVTGDKAMSGVGSKLRSSFMTGVPIETGMEDTILGNKRPLINQMGDTVGGYITNKLRGLTGLASGGVVYGDTVVRVGEYAGASSNPEIVAPQSIMRETLEDANMGVIDALYAMSSRVCKAIEQNRAVVNVGGKQLADDVTRQQNDRAKITGKPILAV